MENRTLKIKKLFPFCIGSVWNFLSNEKKTNFNEIL